MRLWHWAINGPEAPVRIECRTGRYSYSTAISVPHGGGTTGRADLPRLTGSAGTPAEWGCRGRQGERKRHRGRVTCGGNDLLPTHKATELQARIGCLKNRKGKKTHNWRGKEKEEDKEIKWKNGTLR